MPSQPTTKVTMDVRALETSAAALLVSLKGIADARVEADATGRIVRVEVVPDGIDDRSAMRNAQSALMAVLGKNVDVNAIAIVDSIASPAVATPSTPPVLQVAAVANRLPEPGVLELKIPPVRHGELNVAARVAFDTLRAAQSSFHGFQFDGAELVRIAGSPYVVVAVKRGGTDVNYCGAAPVLDSVSTASARALMNAVGTAAMGSNAIELELSAGGYEVLEA